jgi:hypothetical protein
MLFSTYAFNSCSLIQIKFCLRSLLLFTSLTVIFTRRDILYRSMKNFSFAVAGSIISNGAAV